MPSSGGWQDAVRLSVGTLTVVPVRPPTRVDRRVAGRSMLLAPVVGLFLGLGAGLVLIVAREIYGDPWLPSALTLGALALATRGLHLDGLADTADGLGASRHGRARALEVMRRGDIGPFGVVTLVLVLVLQLVTLRDAVLQEHGTVCIVTACVVGRLAATWACTTSIPAAHDEGMGATVAGSVSRLQAALLTLVVLAAAALAGGSLDDDARAQELLMVVTAVAVGLLLAGALLTRCVRRFGGVTGDVLGALVEVGALGVMLVLAR